MVKYISLAALLLGAMPVSAAELKPLDAGSFDVGAYHGIVYFSDEQDGYRVVATIANGETGLPVRFEATLTPTQNLSISVPGKLGEQSRVFTISRAGTALVIEPMPIPKEELVVAAPSSPSQQ
jgi:hypothetical protein